MSRLMNWSGTVSTDPARIVHPGSVQEVIEILRDGARFPSPVRVLGSNHSTTACGSADGGTVVRLDRMNRVLEVGADFVRAEAGALYIDVGAELARHGLEFFVNLEIGNISMGSAACCATKDGAFTGQYGQASSYCTAMTLVTSDGKRVTIDESQPQLLAAARSSYGLLGVVCEVTFRVRPVQPISVEHRNYSIEGFVAALPELVAAEGSVAFYVFPFLDAITVQLRRPAAATGRPNRWVWRLRNFGVAYAVPLAGRLIGLIPGRRVRDVLAAAFYQLARQALRWLVHSGNTIARDQTTRYRHHPGPTRFAFSLWAFDEASYPKVLREYVSLVRQHYRSTGYRSYMLTVGYRVSRDDKAWFSYSSACAVLTLDPVSGGEPGWEDFLSVFNAFCSRNGGRPLLNQTPGLAAVQMIAAFGDKVQQFEDLRVQWDPGERLLNPYFRALLQRQRETPGPD